MAKVEDDGGPTKSKLLKINHYTSQEENANTNNKIGTSQKVQNSENFSSLVAAHYNALEDSRVEFRYESRIVYLRNFNNWIKTVLIKDGLLRLPEQSQRNLKVLDMCCGKGGDLYKWAKLNARYMVCADIAENSLELFKNRYKDDVRCYERMRRQYPLQCEFIAADCTRVRLRGKYRDPSIRFDIVSSQFSFHYGFESLPQAECMLKNITECLKPGGIFIGTIPNANEIVKRLKQSNSTCIKSHLFSIEMCCSEPYPLFGAKYNFYLEGVVNCPEFLVHFPTFVRLAEKYGLELIEKESFTDYFERWKKRREGEMLLRKMKALECYPPDKNKKLVGSSEDYAHAKVYCKDFNTQRVGTLSKSEWEVFSLYQTFLFKKVETK